MDLSDWMTFLVSTSDSSEPSYYRKCLRTSTSLPLSSLKLMLTTPVDASMLVGPKQQKLFIFCHLYTISFFPMLSVGPFCCWYRRLTAT